MLSVSQRPSTDDIWVLSSNHCSAGQQHFSYSPFYSPRRLYLVILAGFQVLPPLSLAGRDPDETNFSLLPLFLNLRCTDLYPTSSSAPLEGRAQHERGKSLKEHMPRFSERHWLDQRAFLCVTALESLNSISSAKRHLCTHPLSVKLTSCFPLCWFCLAGFQ